MTIATLDLDETLISTVAYDPQLVSGSPADATLHVRDHATRKLSPHPWDLTFRFSDPVQYCVLFRPGLAEFLQRVQARFSSWTLVTRASLDYAELVAASLPVPPVEVISVDGPPFGRPNVKDLHELFPQERVFILDDMPQFVRGTCLTIRPWKAIQPVPSNPSVYTVLSGKLLDRRLAHAWGQIVAWDTRCTQRSR